MGLVRVTVKMRRHAKRAASIRECVASEKAERCLDDRRVYHLAKMAHASIFLCSSAGDGY
jgi:poly(3-hydroxybutyrate) depolymerase